MDNELNSIDGAYTSAEYWQYDARLGRRWNRDPIVHAWESAYATFSDNPIYYSDPSGLENTPTGDKKSNPNGTEGGPKEGEYCDNPDGSFETYTKVDGWGPD
jgi:hypothetical protein